MKLLALGLVAGSLLGIGVLGMQAGSSPGQKPSGHIAPEKDPRSPKRPDKVRLSEAEWKKRLTPEQFRILRWSGTEPAFCSKLLDNKKVGDYRCVGCDLVLFRTEDKFDSGTGWPSFFRPSAKAAIWTREDIGFGMVRTEVLCARCDGHLGHVFDDAPQTPTGLRYCINGEILKFVARK